MIFFLSSFVSLRICLLGFSFEKMCVCLNVRWKNVCSLSRIKNRENILYLNIELCKHMNLFALFVYTFTFVPCASPIPSLSLYLSRTLSFCMLNKSKPVKPQLAYLSKMWSQAVALVECHLKWETDSNWANIWGMTVVGFLKWFKSTQRNWFVRTIVPYRFAQRQTFQSN